MKIRQNLAKLQGAEVISKIAENIKNLDKKGKKGEKCTIRP